MLQEPIFAETPAVVNGQSGFQKIIQKQRKFFTTGKTKDVDFRIQQLEKLKDALIKNEKALEEALYKDLHKPEFEAFVTEVGVTVAEIKYIVNNLRSWAKPQKVSTPLFFQPGTSRIHSEPFGVALIISPWNYPLKNLAGPLLGAISAGNTIVVKPSELSPATSAVIARIFKEIFDPAYIAVIEGGPAETQELLSEKFDYILFTGGTEIGRIVYQAAAKHLTPVTLELGGKSPCIVDSDIDLEVAAKRIAWGKFLNAGQVCIAPDYVLVNKNIKKEFLDQIKTTVSGFFGDDPKKSKDFGRIISNKHFHRVKGLISGDVIHGGQSDESQKYIAPTIIDNVTTDHKVMQEEIFGPIMPVIEYENLDDVISIINKGSKPLALYIFSRNKEFQDKIIRETSSGAVVVNETITHAGHSSLPFGGVGSSGMGAYNGKIGFDTFSHKKPVLYRSFLFDVKQKYAPYTDKNLSFIKFAIKNFF